MEIEEMLQEILKKAGEDFKKVADEAVSDVITQYLPHALTDTDANVWHRTNNAIENLIAGKFKREGNYIYINCGSDFNAMVNIKMSTYTYDNLRKSMLEIMPQCPKDLEIKMLKDTVEQLMNQSRY